MLNFLMRRFGIIISLCLLSLFAASVRAELVWTPGDGWRIEGGALSGLVGADARNALDMMNRARAAEEAGNEGAALRIYKRVSRDYPNSLYSPEAYFRTGHIRLSRKQYYKAFEAFQTVMTRYPNNARFQEVLGEQYQIATTLMDGARNHMWGVVPTFRSKERAISFFEWVVQNAPYSDYSPLALMNIARAHQKLKNTPYAIDALDRLINNYPQSLLAPDAYLQLAHTHATLVDGPNYDQEATIEAITYFEDFMILFPEDGGLAAAQQGLDEMRTVLAESKMVLADYYFNKIKNYQGARVFYNEAITTYPNSPIAERARERLALVNEISPPLPETDEDDESPLATQPEQPKRKKFLGIF